MVGFASSVVKKVLLFSEIVSLTEYFGVFDDADGLLAVGEEFGVC